MKAKNTSYRVLIFAVGGVFEPTSHRSIYLPMNLESLSAGTVTLRVSNDKNAPNSNDNPAPDTQRRYSRSCYENLL